MRNPPTLPSLGRGRAAPGTTAGVELCIRKSTKATPIASSNAATVPSHAEDSNYLASQSDGWHLGLERLRRASAGPFFVQQWRLRGQPSRGQQLYGFRKRRMAPQAWKPSPRLSRPSLRLAMVPQWPARPRTAVIWIPKATDGTSGLKTLAAPQPAQSSSSNGATVASQAQDSSYMDSKSDGWHLGLENPRRASAGPVFVQQWRYSGQPGPGQQLYGFRKRRMAPQPWEPSPRLSRPSLRPAMAPPWPAKPRTAVIWLPKATDGTQAWKPSPRLSRPSLRLAMAPQWPARPRTAVIWIPKATDGTSALKTLAAPQPAQSLSSNGASVASQAEDSSYMASESDGWHLRLENPRRASAGPVFVQQWWQSLA